MALFNYANREITAKVVYYGPGVCGKTTSLEYIHERIAPSQRGRLLSLATETDRTIFFDLLPLKLGEIGGFKLRFQLYTVPGQVKYNKTRKLVLQGADAIVFVADSQKSRREANIESFKNLRENLLEQNRRLEEIPLAYEFNKRDLPDILPIDDLNDDLNPDNLPYFATIATKGVGVMETLETISKQALHDMEQRLTAGSPVEEEEEDADEDLLLSNDLMDLTSEDFELSGDELGSLELESDLGSAIEQEEEEDFSLETRPIGYDNDIPLEEFEVRDEEVAQTGTLKESEFFNLKDVEEQALRELDSFLEGSDEDEDDLLNLDTPGFSDMATSVEEEQSFSAFSFDQEPDGEDDSFSVDDEQDFTSFTFGQEPAEQDQEESLDEEEQGLEFTLDSGTDDSSFLEFETADTLTPEESLQVEESLDLSLDEQSSISEDESDLTFSLEEEEAALEGSLSFELESSEEDPEPEFDLEEPDLTTADEDDAFLDLELDEESSSAKGHIESLDLSDADLDLTFGEEQGKQEDLEQDLPAFSLDEVDEQGEATEFSLEDEDLGSFSLDEEDTDEEASDKPTSFQHDQSAFGGAFGEEMPAEEDQEAEYPDFRITDSVKFEMQVGDEISSGTPFEQQLEQLSSREMFNSEEEGPTDEFQPVSGETADEEQFQTISDEWTRLMVLAKHFYHRGEQCRIQRTIKDNVLALALYFTAVETALKAVASKYETCNPALASFHLLLESIEEETDKPVAGAKSIRNNILMMKNRVQLEGGFPDDEECELAARISERFLSSLAQDFLTIDFDKLSPVLPRPEQI